MPDTKHTHLTTSDADFAAWVTNPARTEDELRDAYVAMETERATLWAPGHPNSFRRDRYEVDARCVTRLVQVKRALTAVWQASGQLTS